MDTSFTSLMATLDRKAASIVVTKRVDFDIEKESLGQAVPLRSVRPRETGLRIQQGGQNQQDQHHHKQQDPDAMIQILASAHAQPICW
jgi:hypothetical protein